MTVRWHRILFAVILLAASVTALPALAQDDIETIRATVQAWLLRDLAKPTLILVNYTYEGTSWADTSMGCPVAGQTYQPGTVHGYRWTFEFDNRVRYEVHSSIDGTTAVLCSAVNAGTDVSLTTYSTPAFTILSPESWLVFPGPDSKIEFGPEPGAPCDQPGMRVSLIGRVASGVTPDQLIDEYLAAQGAQDSPTERQMVGTYGRTAQYAFTCDDVTQFRRVAMFVEYGTAYRVEQWTPQADAAKWDPLFLNMLSQFSPPGGSVAAPDSGADSGADSEPESGANSGAVLDPSTLPPFPLAHMFVGDVFIGALNDIPGRSVTTLPGTVRQYLSFAPDGLFIAYIDVADAQLRVMNATEGRSPRRMALGIRTDFPPAWSPDSQWIAYATDSGETDADGTPVLKVSAVHRLSGEARDLTTFAFDGDCPADDGSDPADAVYGQETGQNRVLAWAAGDRLLVSPHCDGGLMVISLADGQRVDLGDDLQGGVLAPDGVRFVARTPGGLAVLDFDAWKRTNLTGGAGAQQIAWGADGQTLYFSTVSLADSTTLDDPGEQARGEAVFGAWPVTVHVYTLTLVRLDLATGTETVLWQSQGRGIGRIAPAPDGSGVLFSQISSSVLLAEAFQSGADDLAIHAAWPQPTLYWLPTDGLQVTLLAYAGQPVFAPITVGGPS